MSERVLLVVVDGYRKDNWRLEDVTDELNELVRACGGEVVEKVVCRIRKPNASYLIGEGKVEEIAALCASLDIQSVIVGEDLKGSQQRNLEEAFKVKTIDRTQLILDIFARRAISQEGRMQVELAQLEYLLPRLTGKGVELSRLGGGIGSIGPGETKLETDRRRISARISKLQKDLKQVSQDRELKRKKRQEHEIPTVCLVGYTNAGKTTLLNTLTDAGRLTHDGLFTTLDPLARRLVLANNREIVISDTVGFMHALPHHLIESFKATLEDVQEADLLLHVLDISHPNFRQLNEAVLEVLRELESEEKPLITVLNKIDRLPDKSLLKEIEKNFTDTVHICALSGENIPQLLERISLLLASGQQEVELSIPLDRMDMVNLLHTKGKVLSIKYESNSVEVRALVPKRYLGKVKDWIRESKG